MNRDTYRKDIEARLAEAKDSLAEMEGGKMFYGKREPGDTGWVDITGGLIASTKRTIGTYEQILADLAERGY